MKGNSLCGGNRLCLFKGKSKKVDSLWQNADHENIMFFGKFDQFDPMNNLTDDIMNKAAGNIITVNIATSCQLSRGSHRYRPLPARTPELSFNIWRTGKPRIENMGAGYPADMKPPGLKSQKHVLHTTRGFSCDPIRVIPLSDNIDPGCNLRSVLYNKAQVGRGEGTTGVRPTDDRFDFCYTVSWCPPIQNPSATYHFRKDPSSFICPVICGMVDFRENQVGSCWFVATTAKDYITPFVDVGCAHRVNR